MFDSEFYPTPPDVIRQMLTPYADQLRQGATLLDPSAGAGAILNYVTEKYSKASVYAIEHNPELIYILQQKYKVIENDFLSYTGGYAFDLIAMNPPFSNGDQHLLKAWEILDEGSIVCLLNRETIDNPYTRTRELLAGIIKDHGSVEYIGQAFKQSDRTTDCDIAMVRLTKKGSERFNFFDHKDRETAINFDEQTLGNEIARANIFDALVSAYEATKRTYLEHIKAHARYLHYNGLLFGYQLDKDKPVPGAKQFDDPKSVKQAYNDHTNELKLQAWNYVLAKTKIEEIVTADVRKDFEKFAGTQGAMDFTVKNINSFFDMLLLNRGTIMDKCVLSVFDHMCSFDPKNKIHTEGWQTNDVHKVNQRVIMPGFVEFDKYGSLRKYKDATERFHVNWHHRHGILHDIDKVMCYILGKKVEDISTIEDSLKLTFEQIGGIRQGQTFDDKAESEFFRMRFFKKGTLHIEFKDKYLWQEFNLRVAKNRNWLPGTKN